MIPWSMMLGRAVRSAWPDLLVAGSAVGLALMCLLFRYLPMVDLPQHHAMVSILVHHRDPAFGFETRYTFDFLGRPYATVYWLGAALAKLLSLGAAMRVVVALCTVAPLGGAYLILRALGRPREWALLAVPFALGSLWHWGFLNFLLGTGLFMACLALVIGLARQSSPARMLALAALAMLLLFTHFHGLVMLFLLAPLFAWGGGARRAARALVPLAPAGLAATAFVLFTWAHAEGHWVRLYPGPWERIVRFIELLAVGIPAPWPLLSMLAFVGIVAAAFALGRPQVSLAALIAWLLQVALYFALPLNTATATYVSARHALLIVLFLLPLLPVLEGGRRQALAAAAAALAATALVVGLIHVARFGREARSFDPVLAAMQPNRRVLPMIYDRNGRFVDPAMSPYLHFAAYYQAARGGDLAHSFADVWNVPIRYRSEYRRYRFPEELEWAPNLITPEQIRHFDYVLVRAIDPPYFAPGLELRQRIRSGPWRLLENPTPSAP
jgi:hypothetical protein